MALDNLSDIHVFLAAARGVAPCMQRDPDRPVDAR